MGSGELGGDDCWGECLCFLRNRSRLCRLANERSAVTAELETFCPAERILRPMGKMTAREAQRCPRNSDTGKLARRNGVAL